MSDRTDDKNRPTKLLAASRPAALSSQIVENDCRTKRAAAAAAAEANTDAATRLRPRGPSGHRVGALSESDQPDGGTRRAVSARGTGTESRRCRRGAGWDRMEITNGNSGSGRITSNHDRFTVACCYRLPAVLLHGSVLLMAASSCCFTVACCYRLPAAAASR